MKYVIRSTGNNIITVKDMVMVAILVQHFAAIILNRLLSYMPKGKHVSWYDCTVPSSAKTCSPFPLTLVFHYLYISQFENKLQILKNYIKATTVSCL